MVNNERTMVMACATVMEEIIPILPPGMHHKILDFGLHIQPNMLRTTLQETIDAVEEDIDTVLLGYGLCSQAVIGLQSNKFQLVVPRVDDCIAIFLGTRSAYTDQCRKEPGTYYLTKGWIEVGSTPFTEYDDMVKRLGPEKAARVHALMMRNYKRLALINTGQHELDRYRAYARDTAERFGLRYEEIEGSNAMVKKMLEGDWQDEFVVVPPGETIHLGHFFQ